MSCYGNGVAGALDRDQGVAHTARTIVGRNGDRRGCAIDLAKRQHLGEIVGPAIGRVAAAVPQGAPAARQRSIPYPSRLLASVRVRFFRLGGAASRDAATVAATMIRMKRPLERKVVGQQIQKLGGKR